MWRRRHSAPGSTEWRRATEGESAVDFGLSGVITAQQERPEDDIPWAIGEGVASFKCFFVYDFGVDAATPGGAADGYPC